MAKTKISEYDATAANNTDIDSINIAEGMAPSNVNNAIREMMAHLKDMDAGTQALTSPQLTSVDINGGTIDGVTIGGASAGAGTFTNLTATGTTALSGTTFSGNVSFGDNNITNVGSLQVDDIAGDTDGNTFIAFPGSDVMTMHTGNVEAIRIDASQNVGIGISNATEKFTVVNSSSGIVGRFTNNTNQTLDLGVVSGSGAAGGVFFNNANSGYLAFQSGGTEAMRIASGNVGISSTGNAIDEMLHLEKSTGTTLVKTEVGGNSTVGFEIKKTGSTTSNWRIADGQTVNGKLEIFDVTDSRSIMTFDGDGKVGISTISPDGLLHIFEGGDTGGTAHADADTLILENDGNSGLTIMSSTSGKGTINFDDAGGNARGSIVFDHSTDNLTIDVAGNIIIDADVDVGIGTTSPQSAAHLKGETAALGVDDYPQLTIETAATSGAANTGGGILFLNHDGTGGSFGGSIQSLKENGTSGNSAHYMRFSTRANGGSVTERMRIRSTGEILHTLPSEDTTFSAGTDSTWNRFEILQDRGASNTASGIAFRSQSGTAPAGIAGVALNTTGGREELAFITSTGNASVERMRLDENGNVGIGAVPSGNLTAGYILRLDGGSQTYLAFNNDTHTTQVTGGFVIGNDGSSAYLVQRENQPLAFHTNDSEAMRIDSSGNVLVGTTVAALADATSGSGIALQADGQLEIARAGTGSSDVCARFNRSNGDGSIVEFRKSGVTVGSVGTSGGATPYFANASTGGIRLGTSSGATVLVACNESGALEDNLHDIGASSTRWDDIHATNGTIQTSDRNEKQDIAELTETEMKVGKRISALFKTFRWKSKVTEKGDAARTHTGIIAQDVQAAFSAEGLDASKYALWCSDTWTNDDGSEQTRMGVRYPELLSFLASYNEQRFTDIEARITALEGA